MMKDEKIIIELINLAETEEQILALLEDSGYSVGALEAGLPYLEEYKIMSIMRKNFAVVEKYIVAIPLLKKPENVSCLIYETRDCDKKKIYEIGLPLLEKIMKTKTEEDLVLIPFVYEMWVDVLISQMALSLISDSKNILSFLEKCIDSKSKDYLECKKLEIISAGIVRIRELLENK